MILLTILVCQTPNLKTKFNPPTSKTPSNLITLYILSTIQPHFSSFQSKFQKKNSQPNPLHKTLTTTLQ